MLRKAFTMLELIFIVTIVAILSSLMLPRLQSSNLQEATDQVMKHMRLAQSFAMAQDFYLADANQSNDYVNANQRTKSSTYWFKRWWRVQFHQIANPRAYSIYSDHPSNVNDSQYDAQPDAADLIATDAHSGQLIVRGIAGIDDTERLKDVDIGSEYGISISMANCSHVNGGLSTSRHILFDNMGRPHCGKGENDVSFNPYDHLSSAQIRVTLTHNRTNESNVICVEPESGYIHICG